jgi:DNA-binding response OmpR family regulator
MNRILIVEDESSIQKLLKIKLSANGYEVILSDNGVQGLEMVEQMIPDMVILDIKMPVMSGWDFLKELRHNPKLKDIPVLLITGLTSDQQIAEQTNLPCLFKPFKLEEMLYLVESALNKHTEILPMQHD